MATTHPSAHPPAAPGVRRHPIRGALWGLPLGLGLSLLLIGRKVIAFGTLTPILVILVGVALGVLAGTVLPAKGREPAPPADAGREPTGSWGPGTPAPAVPAAPASPAAPPPPPAPPAAH